MAAEQMERWLIQVVIPKGTYSGADELMPDLVNLIDMNSEIEVVSCELDPDQSMGDPNKC